MDDTAFHYSRSLRIITVLAIVVPIVVIGLILWHFGAFDSAPVPEEAPAVTTTAPAGTSPAS